MSLTKALRGSAIALAVAAIVLSVGCAPEPEPAPEPKVDQPSIGKSGVFRAGVDLSMPPYAGLDGSTKAGIDVDVAAAVAERLGLSVEYVDVVPSEAATALAEGTVDAVFSIQIESTDLSRVTSAGTYLHTAPGIFAVSTAPSTDASVTLDSLPVTTVAAQQASPAFWLVRAEFGEENLEGFETLREALGALSAGSFKYAVGDAVVATYIARDFPNVRLVGQLAEATPFAVGVSAENAVLSDAVRGALDELAADGVLDTIRRKWLGELPELRASAASAEESPTAP